MAQRMQPIVLEEREILFRNFSGREGKFNAEGDRNFNVLLQEEEAEAMKADGWNIKYLEPREEGDERRSILQVTVKYGPKNRPPRIVLLTSKGKTPLDESDISLLDWAEIINVDLNIRPYEWEVSGKTGVKAYLQSIYVTIREDPLDLKYADVADSASTAIVAHSGDSDEDQAPFRE